MDEKLAEEEIAAPVLASLIEAAKAVAADEVKPISDEDEEGVLSGDEAGETDTTTLNKLILLESKKKERDGDYFVDTPITYQERYDPMQVRKYFFYD